MRARQQDLLDEIERLRAEVERLRGTPAVEGQDAGPVESETAPASDEQDGGPVHGESAPESGPEGETVPRERYRDLEGKFQRLSADFDNQRKRSARETERLVREQTEKFMRALLPVVDNMERGLQHMGEDADLAAIRRGVESTYAQFCEFLDGQGLVAIEALGRPFDPQIHEAMFRHPTNDVEPDHVAFEVEKGYMWGDKLLRPTRVGVAMPAPVEEGEEAGGESRESVPETDANESDE